MERASKEVMKRKRRGGNHCPCMLFRRKVFCCLLVFSSIAFAQTHDVLLVEKPEHLVVYNSFQQSLTAKQQGLLQPFAPIKILKSHDLLGDGLTSCMKVEIDGDLHFLLRDASGALAGFETLGMVKSFSSRSFIADTIEILASNVVSLQNPSTGIRSPLVAGNLCVRYFVNAGATYLKQLGARPRYGWGTLPAGKAGSWWKRVNGRVVRHSVPAAPYERIAERIRQINQSLSGLHAMFARETGKKLPIPQWVLLPSGPGLQCSLQPMGTFEAYQRTASELSVSLQTYLIGTGYEAVQRGQVIEIRLR
jgi:hypothetical protein